MMGSFNYVCEGQMSIFDILNSPKPRFKIDKPVRLIELFGGIGATSMALRDIGANFEHYRLVEFDKYKIAAYNAIHGTKFETMDITQISGEDLGIVDKHKYCYLLTYSFPCQDLSLAGQQKGMEKGTNTRSSLLWEVERLLNEVSELPQVLLMENVPQVHSYKNMEHFQKWIEFLESKGYSNYWQDLNAKDYGVAQSRNRCFMVSILGEYTYEFPKPVPLTKTMKDYLEPEVDDKYYITSEKAKLLIEKLIKNGKIPNEEENMENTKYKDFTGFKNGRLTVLGFDHSNKNKRYWLCKCECGKETIVPTDRLKITKSCGCLQHDKVTTHGLKDTRLYSIWASMKNRCNNPKAANYKYYGAKGITVCDEWNSSFESFYDWAMANGYEDNLTIDRIDNLKNYEPGNCRWITTKEQCNNRSTTRFITFEGKTMSVSEWADYLKIPYSILNGRLQRKWSEEKALTTPWTPKDNLDERTNERTND